MTDAEVRNILRLAGFPSDPDLTDAEIDNAALRARIDLKDKYPLATYGVFTTVANRQVYDLFNPIEDLTTQQGVFPTGIRALEILWDGGCTTGSNNDFGIGPWLQGMGLPFIDGFSPYSFRTPADYAIFDANWSSFVKRFGTKPFEHVENRPGAAVRLFPVPGGASPAFIRYLRYRTMGDLQSEDESWYLKFVEAYCCDVLAAKLSCVAGVTIGGLRNDGKASAYWDSRGKRCRAEAEQWFENRSYISTSGAQRI